MRRKHVLFASPLLLLPLAFTHCVGDPAVTPDSGMMQPDSMASDSTVNDTGVDTGVGMDGGMEGGPCVIEAGALSGKLDPSFNNGVNMGLAPSALAIGGQQNNIFVAGQTSNCPNNNTNLDFAVMKYSPLGQIVSGFGTNGRACASGGANNGNDFVYAVAVDFMGRIILAGTFRGPNDASSNAGVIRFDSGGNIDTNFATGGRFTFSGNFDYIYGLKTDSSGKIIVVGSDQHPFATQTTAFVARLNANGALDVGFNGGNTITDANARAYFGVTIDAQQNVYVAGSTASNPRDFILKKYTSLGMLDTTFGSSGTTTVGLLKGAQGAEGRDLIISPQGGLWAMGVASLNAGEIGIPVGAAYTLNGIADTNTFPNGVVPGRVGAGSAVIVYDTNYQLRSINSQCDGKVVLAGRYDLPDGGQDMGILRFNPNGQLDMSFGMGGVARSTLNGDDVPVGIAQDSTNGLVMVGGTGTMNQHVLARFVP